MTSIGAFDTVFTTGDAVLAGIIKNALEAEGLWCAVENEHQAAFVGVLDVRVMTRSDDSERARRIIREHLHHGESANDGPDKKPRSAFAGVAEAVVEVVGAIGELLRHLLHG